MFFNIKNIGPNKVIYFLGLKMSFDRFKLLLFRSRFLKIDNNKIVFVNFTNKSYGCNPKYIAEEIIRQNLPYKMVWLVKDPKKEKQNFPPNIKLVKSNSYKALRELRSAKFWISNSRLNYYIKKGLKKRYNQVYIQTWHGYLGIKKIEGDIANKGYEKYICKAKSDSKMIDYLISPSEFDANILKNCFWYDKAFLNVGYPRNDIFFLSEEEKYNKISEIKSKLNIPDSKKILLYVPTFRDSKTIDVYDLDFDEIQNALKERFSSDYIVLAKLHPNMLKKATAITKKFPNVINVTKYPDTQELLLIADALITDYSSAIFDYMYLKKPAFIYANDIEDYYKERGFYLDIKNLFAPIAYTNKDMISNIKNFDKTDYLNKLEKFIHERNCYDRGIASKACVDLINKIYKQDLSEGKSKDINIEYYDYLKKYLYVLDKPENHCIKSDGKNTNKIWQMWWQGEDKAPELVKKCLSSVREFYPDKQIIITEQNYKSYIDIPDYILKRYKSGEICFANFSDLVRLFLLTKYGGVWIDATCLLTKMIPSEILNSELFYFKNATWFQNPKVPSEKLFSELINVPSYLSTMTTGSSWFIVTDKPNNRVLVCLMNLLLEYWMYEDYAINYFIFHILLTLIIMNDKKSREIFEKMISENNRNPHLLQMMLEKDYNEELFENIKEFSFIHKLRYKNLTKAQINKNSFLNYLLK